MALIRRQKLLDRERNRRDARLFVIATEGAKTEHKYLQTFVGPGIKVELLACEQNRSAPQYVLERLTAMTKQYDLDGHDELWLVLDVDQWPERTLQSVYAKAKRQGFHIAISNPCFEVWLCCHFSSCSDDSIDQAAQGRKAGEALKHLWRAHLPPSATQIERTHLRPQAHTACERARAKDTSNISTQQPWPEVGATRVYVLVEKLLELLKE